MAEEPIKPQQPEVTPSQEKSEPVGSSPLLPEEKTGPEKPPPPLEENISPQTNAITPEEKIITPDKGASSASESTPPPEDRAKEILRTDRSPFKKILSKISIGLFIILLLFLAFKFLVPKIKKVSKPKEVTLTYWGLWESKGVLDLIIADFQKEHPHIKINYSQQYHKDYRERLQSALARSEGPDIFRFHNTWLPMFKNELASVPPDVFDAMMFEATFYPVVKADLRSGTNYYGIPLMFDSLSLFINREIFRAAGKTPPETWDELRKTAIELTVYDSSGRIKTAGVALGETANVDHWSDIFGLMMLQNGVDLSHPTGSLAEDAVTFYTLFSTTDRVWDKTLPPSTYAFATGQVAMIFAPSWRVFNIKEINPDLDFEIVAVPQLPGQEVTWATYWSEGVSKKSEFQEEAWEWLKFLSQKETVQRFYSEASKVRLFGEIPARTDLADLLKNNPLVAPFLEQAPFAQSWYLCSRTWDNGLNEKMIKYFEDAVNSVLAGKAPKEALQTAAQGVSQVLSQYKAP